MNVAILLLALCGVRPEVVLEDRFDIIELSHYYNDQGEPVFSQYLFRNWVPERGRFEIEAWRLVKDAPATVGESLLIWDVKDGVLRRIRGKQFLTTHLQYDAEMDERWSFPASMRRELSQPLKREREKRKD
jgi:hypothetical protein